MRQRIGRWMGVRQRATARLRRTTGAACPPGDGGNAVIEFVFVAVVVLVPLVYLVVSVAQLERSRLAASNAARDIGRAIATAGPGDDPGVAADAALRIALRGQGLGPSDVEVRFVAAHAACTNSPVVPSLTAGAEFTVCVTRREQLPGVPAIVAGRGIATVGRYLVHIDDFAAAPSSAAPQSGATATAGSKSGADPHASQVP